MKLYIFTSLFLVQLFFVILAPTVADGQNVPVSDEKNDTSHVELSFKAAVGDLFIGIPFMEDIKGVALVKISSEGIPDGANLFITISSEDVRFHGIKLDSMKVDIITSMGDPVTLTTIDIKSSIFNLSATFAMDLDFDFGPVSDTNDCDKTELTEEGLCSEITGRRVEWLPGTVKSQIELKITNLETFTELLSLPTLGGSADITLTVSGDSRNPEIVFGFDLDKLAWRGEQIGTIEGQWDHLENSSHIQLRWSGEEKSKGSVDLKIPLAIDLHEQEITWLDKKEHKISVLFENLDRRIIKLFWKIPAGVDFVATLSMTGEGTLDHFELESVLSGQYLYETVEPETFLTILKIMENKQSLSFLLGDNYVVADFESGISLVDVRRKSRRMESAPLTGRIDLDLPLKIMEPFFWRGIGNPTGLFNGRVDFDGTLGNPIPNGTFELLEGELTMIDLSRRLKNVEIKGSVNGPTVTFETIFAKSSPGNCIGQGKLDFKATPEEINSGDLWSQWKLEGGFEFILEKFPVVQRGFPVSIVQGSLNVNLIGEPGKTDIVFELDSMEVNLTEEELPRTSSIPNNRTVNVIDSFGADLTEDNLLAGEGHLHLEILANNPIWIHGPKADLQIDGHVILDRTDDIVRVEGGFTPLPGGILMLFENEFEIRTGFATIAEGYLGEISKEQMEVGAVEWRDAEERAPEAAPLEFELDMVAKGLVVDTHVVVKLHGPVRRPLLTLMSVPPIPEYQIMTLLVSGRVDAVDDRNGNVRREVANMVARYHNPSLKRQLFDRLGVDNLGLGFGSSVSNPILTVGKQVTRQLYVETVYHHSAPPDVNIMEGHVEYHLGKEWTFNTVFGEAAEGSFGIFWTTSFGGEPPPTPEEGWELNKKKVREDDDGDGLENPFDRCRFVEEDLDGFQDDDGCPEPDNDNDGIEDTVDGAPLLAETVNGFEDEDGKPDIAPMRYLNFESETRHFNFEASSTELTPEAESTARAFFMVLELLPDLYLHIDGHSDHLGGERRKLEVSEERAVGARESLIRMGIGVDRFSVLGHGAQMLIDEDTTPEARMKNRRVELKLSLEGTRE